MRRTDLEHIIRAAGSITGDDEMIIVGSQAILGQFPDAPDALLRSMEADIYPKNKAHLSDLIDGSIGELSPFHRAFGYYAHGVARKTIVPPDGWEQRLIPIKNRNTRGIIRWCLYGTPKVFAYAVGGQSPRLPALKDRVRDRILADFGLNKE